MLHKGKYVRFQVLMAASMKMIAFWDVVLCSLVVDRHFRTPSGTSVFYETTWRNIPEGYHFQGKVKS
jgi:hypothetical protein